MVEYDDHDEKFLNNEEYLSFFYLVINSEIEIWRREGRGGKTPLFLITNISTLYI